MFKFKFFSMTNPPIKRATKYHVASMAELTKTAFVATYIDPDNGKGCFNDSELDGLRNDVLSRYPNLLEKPEHLLLVAEEKNTVVGYAKLDLREDCVILDRIYVLPDRQASGYGSLLLQACFKATLHQFGKTTMSLDVWEKNEKAIQYYKKNGFEKTPKTYCKTPENGIAYYGFEMICTNVQKSHKNLSEFIEKNGLISLPDTNENQDLVTKY